MKWSQMEEYAKSLLHFLLHIESQLHELNKMKIDVGRRNSIVHESIQ